MANAFGPGGRGRPKKTNGKILVLAQFAPIRSALVVKRPKNVSSLRGAQATRRWSTRLESRVWTCVSLIPARPALGAALSKALHGAAPTVHDALVEWPGGSHACLPSKYASLTPL